MNYKLRKMEKTYHKVVNGDSRRMEELRDESMHLINKLQDFVRHFDEMLPRIWIRPKSVVHDVLAKRFSDIVFEEPPIDRHYVSHIDFMARVGEKAFGLQVTGRVATADASLAMMKVCVEDFEQDFGGKVFIILSPDGEVGNPEVLQQIEDEISKLKAQ